MSEVAFSHCEADGSACLAYDQAGTYLTDRGPVGAYVTLTGTRSQLEWWTDMLELNPLANDRGVNRPAVGTDQSRRRPAAAEQTPVTDTVEVSDAALAEEREVAMRDDLVARVRAEIEAGTYLTRDKVNGAVDRLLSTLAIRDT